ncbi:MAG: hypothetical protein ACQESR_03870 [Planctomycetota bacterium]
MVCPEDQIGLTLLGRYKVTRYRGNGCDGWLFVAAPSGQGLLVDVFDDMANRKVMLEVIRGGIGYDPRQVDDLAAMQPHPHLLQCQEIGLVGDGDLAGASFVVWEMWEDTLAGALARGAPMDEQAVRAVAKEVAAALARYHCDNRPHGDVRVERICRVDGHWKLAPVLRRKTDEGGANGRDALAAPDDIYALGLMLLHCLSRRSAPVRAEGPLGCPSSRAEVEQVLGKLPEFWQYWLGRCLAAEPAERCSAAELALMDSQIPSVVAEVFLDREGDRYRVSWRPPADGVVRVYRWSRGEYPARGEIWLRADLERIAENVPLTMDAGTHVQVQPGSACRIIVATVAGEATVIGESITVTWAGDVERLRLTVEGKAIVATWDWPVGAHVAQVAVRETAFATGPDDPKAQMEQCFRPGCVADGGRVVIPMSPRAVAVHVTVYAMYRHEDGWERASGRTTGARATITVAPSVRVRYRVEKVSLFARLFLKMQPWRLSMRADRTATLPELSLVAGESRTRSDVDNGIALLEVPRQQYEAGTLVRKDFRPPKGIKMDNARLLPRGQSNDGVRVIPERVRLARVSK